MATSLSQRSANPTQKQLDDLDALLQRMLDLPVNQLDATPAPAPPPVSYTAPDEPEEPTPPKIDFQALKQRLTAQMDLVNTLEASAATAPPEPAPAEPAPPSSSGDEGWVPLSSTWQPSSLTWKPLAQSWQQPPASEPVPAPVVEPPQASAETPVWEPSPTAPADAAPTMTAAFQIMQGPPRSAPVLLDLPNEVPIARWATPLVWFNLGFDWCLRPLGTVGRLLQTRPGRLTLAVLGVGCLIAAAAVVFLDWIGWTS